MRGAGRPDSWRWGGGEGCPVPICPEKTTSRCKGRQAVVSLLWFLPTSQLLSPREECCAVGFFPGALPAHWLSHVASFLLPVAPRIRSSLLQMQRVE